MSGSRTGSSCQPRRSSTSRGPRLGGLARADYTNPLFGETVAAISLPIFVLGAMLAAQYRAAQQETASLLLVGTVGSLLTTGAFIALTSGGTPAGPSRGIASHGQP